MALEGDRKEHRESIHFREVASLLGSTYIGTVLIFFFGLWVISVSCSPSRACKQDCQFPSCLCKSRERAGTHRHEQRRDVTLGM